MTPEMLAIRQRLLDSFPYYAENALKIRTKPDASGKASIAPLILNAAQRELQAMIDRQLEARGYVRIVILKGRQMGLSTHVGGWLFWWVSQRVAQKAIVVAHEGKATTTLFDMTRRYYDKVPEILKPHSKYSSRKELVFDKLDSSYSVVTAGGDGIGRSETITAAHLSELAWWPKNTAQENFSGLMDTIPAGPGTAVFIESTANGLSGLFYDQCQKARSGESDFEFIFLPWFIEPGYRLPAPADFERSPEEEKLVEEYGLDNEQLMFRRARVAEKGVDLFKQEYPCNADEAFLTSGRPVFNPDKLVEMRQHIRKPLRRMALEGDTFEEHPLGELKVYRELDPREQYFIGADVGQGVRKDFSVAQVLDSKRRQAAIWRSDRVIPEFYGTTLAKLGEHFNNAMVICESNGPGQLTNYVMFKEHVYPWVYQETVYDKTTDTETDRVGFLTTEKSKSLVINKLRATLRGDDIEIYDADTLAEMQSYIVTESGRLEAEKGCHDDCVMALALADHINDGSFDPVVNEDAFYESIE